MHEDVLDRRLDEICGRLGYLTSGTFVTADTLKRTGRVSHVVREAIVTIGVSGVFGLTGPVEPTMMRPVVYIAKAANKDELHRLRKEVWTQGVVPFLIVVTAEEVMVCSGFEPPSAKALIYDDGLRLPGSLGQLTALALRSSLAWQHFDVGLKSSVDNRLVQAIEALNREARTQDEALRDRRNLVNAAIGRFLYLYVLIDRGIVDEAWLCNAGSGTPGAVSFAKSVCHDANQIDWSARDALRALELIDERINGTVFAVESADRSLLTDRLCRLIHLVLRAGTTVKAENGQQLNFLDVSYKVIRTETISAIYERFVALDAPDKHDDGVFYTPPHLADHVLDRMEEIQPLTETSRIVDPAAGSGVFLVGAYRRLLERGAPAEGWSINNVDRARRLLLDCIYGIEKHEQAANVCRFSLYLTLLDYVGRASIDELAESVKGSKFLPSLTDNIISANAFTCAAYRPRFTHVVGNPPWSQTYGKKDRSNVSHGSREDGPTLEFAASLDRQSEPTRNRLANLFFWLAQKHLAVEDGVIAMILPTRSVVGRDSGPFAHAVAAATTPAFVGNLSHLRRKLFDGPDAAATILVVRNRQAEATDRVAVYRPLLTSLPLGKKNDVWALILAQADMQYFRAKDLRSGSNGWHEQTMLRTLDRRTRGALATWTRSNSLSFGDFLTRSNLMFVRGGSAAETGIDIMNLEAVKRSEAYYYSRVKKPNHAPLEPNELARVNENYRRRFSGNVILVPRSMADSFHVPKPHAYNSSFSAIISKSQETVFEDERDNNELIDKHVAAALIAYLRAPIMRYFAALFGSGQLADDARFEKAELALVPCPFTSVRDPKFLAIVQAPSIDKAILAAMDAGSEFVDAYHEYRDFRTQFENARIPKDSFTVANSDMVESYLKRLNAEISSLLPGKFRMSMEPIMLPDDTIPNVIRIRLDQEYSVERELQKNDRFLGTSIIETIGDGGQIWIWKSRGRHAWTIEQATADAQAFGRELTRTQF